MDTRLLAGGTGEDATARWTRADLDRFPDDGHRRELVDGHLLVSPLARVRHQAIVLAISPRPRRLGGRARRRRLPGVNVELTEDTHLEPDVAWASDTDLEGPGFEATPEFVVEVGAPSTHRSDRGIKRRALPHVWRPGDLLGPA